MKRPLLIFMSFLLVSSVFSQRSNYEKNTDALLKIAEEAKAESAEREKRVSKYLSEHTDELRSFKIDGNEYFLRDIVNGQPQYYKTMNVGSARTTGVNSVRTGGEFGLNLTGVNSRIAIWDSGVSLNSHQEFQGRLINNDSGSNPSDHSTHVMGTLIAGGVNPNARGYCPDADAQAYDWNNDDSEMAEEVVNSEILVSNHSYGIPAGWESGSWRGTPSISTSEDWAFGFYTNNARRFDDIAYNAPFYSIVAAAGNERGESGNGNHPPDGPFDCISDFSVAKNVITVGAVNKINGVYSQPSDVVMSSFSSWGPVDDGRIKPDICAPGVAIFSCTSGSTDDYGNSQGTSMAAPAVAGGVALINEAYHLFNNRFLRAASIRAMLIHTAREAGNADGPDYSFGWGLMAVDEAVRQIIQEDGVGRLITEEVLANGEVFEIELNPRLGTDITATIAWTDLAGPVLPDALDPEDPMLVNDLDLELVDEQGNVVGQPWKLNRNSPGVAATRGNNSVDNVEKIEFDNTDAPRYFLRVSHKGNLESGSQAFSLVLSYESEDPGVTQLYWINGNGDFSDPSHWSLSSGGPSANRIPDQASRVIFDDSSAPSGSTLNVIVDQATRIEGLLAFRNAPVNLTLNEALSASGQFNYASDAYTLSGDLIFINENQDANNNIDLNQSNISDLAINFAQGNAGAWNILDQSWALTDLSIDAGTITMDNCTVDASTFTVGSESNMIMSNNVMNLNSQLSIEGAGFSLDRNNAFNLTGAPTLSINVNSPLQGIVTITNAIATSNSTGPFDQLILDNAQLALNTDAYVEALNMLDLSGISFNSGLSLECNTLAIDNGGQNTIFENTNTDKANLTVNSREKYCFENIRVVNVDLQGNAAISVDGSSNVVNSEGWFLGNCQDLLFANFTASNLCEGAYSMFEDVSDGNIVSRDWYIDGIEAWGDETMFFTFDSPGVYEIRLVIMDPDGNIQEWTESVEVEASGIPENEIIEVSATQLASRQLADAYQWFNYGAPIQDATERIYDFNGTPGIYWVLTFDGNCNRRSETLDLGTNVSEIDANENIDLFPNPFNDFINLEFSDEYFGSKVGVNITDVNGRVLYNNFDFLNSNSMRIDINYVPNGIYFIQVKINDNTYQKRLVKYD